MIWLERKGAAIIQDRIGPIRANIFGIRLFGMLHNIADVIKLLFKEDVVPNHVNKFYYFLGPFWSMTISLIPLMLVPIASPIVMDSFVFRFQVADYSSGILLFFAITGLGVYAIIFAGWSSNNKYSLLGGLRSSSQMISYELGMGLSIVAVLMTFQDISLNTIVEKQSGLLTIFGVTLPLPNWGIFLQPIAFIIFLVAAFAETNRTPFDLAEGESEIVAGYHTEYSSMKFALFFMAEYANMVVASIIISTLFLGGYQVPFFSTEVLRQNPHYTMSAILVLLILKGFLVGWILYKRAKAFGKKFQEPLGKKEYFILSYLMFGLAILSLVLIPIVLQIQYSALAAQIIVAILQILMLLAKAMIFLWLYVQVRWTLPRFRYDQLMNMGWRLMLPISLLNVVVTGIVIAL
ncbi:MAG: complex I subunit 1/NuoH family protein [Leptonema sp. (in: bacteria)]